MLVPVILAGGHGTRLSPISTPSRPKPFLDLLDCGRTLFELTLLRAQQVSRERPIIVVSTDHLGLVQSALNTLDLTAHILLEPCGRNTAPAITSAALLAQKVHGKSSQLLVLAADHYIADSQYFCTKISAAQKLAQQDKLVLFGIRPSHAETGYGYIEMDQNQAIIAFHEKPNRDVAEQYFTSGHYLWNSGFFIMPSQVLLEEMRHFHPNILKVCQAALSNAHTTYNQMALSDQFDQSPSISIDHAVMEHSHKLALCTYESGWSDLGTWPSLYQLWQKDLDGYAHNRSLQLTLTPKEQGFHLAKTGAWSLNV